MRYGGVGDGSGDYDDGDYGGDGRSIAEWSLVMTAIVLLIKLLG